MTTITSTEKIYRLFRKYRKICTDTRQLERDSIFIALHGEKFDGNTFAKQALEAGCSYAIVDNVKFAKGERCLLVEDCLQCLQSLANLYRRDMFIPFIGITGTNGKTTSKELINSVLSIRFRTFATKGNLNNHIGVPLTILSIPSNTEIAIIEMGASHVGEIANLCNICLPTHGLITNIGKAHLEGFGSFENIVNTKTALYRFIQKTHGKSFVNGDNALLMDKSKDLERFCYGSGANQYLQMEYISNESIMLKCKLIGSSSAPNITEINTNVIGDYNLENAAVAACIGRYFGLSDREIKEGIEKYEPKNLRSQIIQTKNNVLIADTYNANPTSMYASIKNFLAMPSPYSKIFIIGDMLELGKFAKEEHQKIVDLLKENDAAQVFLVGPLFSKTDKFSACKTFSKAEDLIEHLKNHPLKQNYILIKGSRGVQLEKVLDILK